MNKSPTYIVSNSSNIEPSALLDYTNPAAKVITTNEPLANSATVLNPPQLPPDILNYRQALLIDIQRVVGANDFLNGSFNFGSATSGQATQNVIDQANLKETSSLVELKTYLLRFVRIVLHFIKQGLINSKQENLVFRTKQRGQQEYDIDSYNLEFFEDFKWLQDFEADVDINIESLRLSSKTKKQQDLVNLFQMELQYKKGAEPVISIIDIAKTLNLPNKDEIIAKLKADRIEEKIQKEKLLLSYMDELRKLGIDKEVGEDAVLVRVIQAIQDPQAQAQLDDFIAEAKQAQAEQQQAEQEDSEALLQQAGGDENLTPPTQQQEEE